MDEEKVDDEHRKKNPDTCELCGETDETVDMWCGAPWGYAHRSCAKIASKGITLWLKRQLWIREELKGWIRNDLRLL